MTARRPTRREPRVLAVLKRPWGFGYAVVDPWEIRSTGTVRATPRSAVSALLRLVRREKPTCLVGRASVRAYLTAVAMTTGLPLLAGDCPTLLPVIAAEMFPEFRRYAPTPLLARVTAYAVAVVLHGDIPSRRYAIRRRSSAPRPGA